MHIGDIWKNLDIKFLCVHYTKEQQFLEHFISNSGRRVLNTKFMLYGNTYVMYTPINYNMYYYYFNLKTMLLV